MSDTAILEAIHALGRELVAVKASLERIEAALRSGGARDDADCALVAAIRASIADREFTSVELVEHARKVDPALKRAMLEADVETAHELGTWLRGVKRTVVAGLAVENVGSRRDGTLWSVKVRV